MYNVKREKIRYDKIMSLGFKEELVDDKVYFNEYGFQYSIVTLNVNKKIHFIWDKKTQFVQLVRTDKEGWIKNEIDITRLDHLETLVSFFKEDIKKK